MARAKTTKSKARPAAKKAASGKSKPNRGSAKKPSPRKSAPAKASAKKGTDPKTEKRNQKLRAQQASASRSDDDDEDDDDESKRNFGLRGAAPWVARHAAKHAEELRRRNAEPPPPGSARATLRTPKQAEEIKTTVAHLHQRTSTINTLRKKLDKSFFEIGELLSEIQTKSLFIAKGYATFESFLDREVEIPRISAMKLVRIVHTFDREAAQDYPLDRLMSALSALDGEVAASANSQASTSTRSIVGSNRGFSQATLPPKPPIRWE